MDDRVKLYQGANMVNSDLERELLKETLKWLERAEKALSKIKATSDPRFVENIEAYIKDSKYFLEVSDLIRAFECVIWAWAWMEIGEEIGILSRER